MAILPQMECVLSVLKRLWKRSSNLHHQPAAPIQAPPPVGAQDAAHLPSPLWPQAAALVQLRLWQEQPSLQPSLYLRLQTKIWLEDLQPHQTYQQPPATAVWTVRRRATRASIATVMLKVPTRTARRKRTAVPLAARRSAWQVSNVAVVVSTVLSTDIQTNTNVRSIIVNWALKKSVVTIRSLLDKRSRKSKESLNSFVGSITDTIHLWNINFFRRSISKRKIWRIFFLSIFWIAHSLFFHTLLLFNFRVGWKDEKRV